jgi:2-keto-4-pentenoate hydratase/2-oxohepta-3-ene-1,7-dioic acid hydratase in catechol pathway
MTTFDDLAKQGKNMKLLRFGPIGQEKPGAMDAQGNIRDLSSVLLEITPEWLTPKQLAVLSAIDLSSMPLVDAGVRMGTPIAGIRQFVAIGLNYRKHAEEAGLGMPEEPVVFNKAITCIVGPNDGIQLPKDSTATDWEVELAFVMGATTHQVSEDDALNYVAGYCLANDVSERDWQIKRGPTWFKGKSFPTFGPLGPWLLTADEVPDPQNIPLSLSVNGVEKQNSNTVDMIFSVKQIIAYLSQIMILLPGDVVITGTPSGVALGMKTPEYLKKGDVVTLSAGGLGTQTQLVS